MNAAEPVQLQQWFSVQGEMDASQPYASLGIYESRGGNLDAPPAIGATEVGVISIAFEDCTHGVLNYHSPMDGIRTGRFRCHGCWRTRRAHPAATSIRRRPMRCCPARGTTGKTPVRA